jgi:hypothetical protein
MWKTKMENRHEKKHHSTFLWGFILGAIFATLLTTKKGRAILRELINMGLEMVEDFVEDRKNASYEKKIIQKEAVIKKQQEDETKDAAEDLKSEIGVSEELTQDTMEVKPDGAVEIDVDVVSEEAVKMAKKLEESEEKPVKRGSRRRLFRGIRKTKAN